MRLPARTLLTCWLIVVATGTVVTHRHAAAPGHTHRLGWATLPTRSTITELPLTHRHFVLLGVELGATETESDDGDAPVPDTAVSALENSSLAASDDTEFATPDYDLFATSMIATSPFEQSLDVYMEPGESSCARPLMSRARTVVLRI